MTGNCGGASSELAWCLHRIIHEMATGLMGILLEMPCGVTVNTRGTKQRQW